MNATKLALQRASWSCLLKTSFKMLAGYKCREHVNDYSNLFVVTHPESPSWKVVVGICFSAFGQKNRLEVNSKLFAPGVSQATAAKLMDLLREMRRMYDRGMTEAREKEAKAANWRERQESELHGLETFEWLDAAIITTGPHAGNYRVTLGVGNPLERLTLAQFKDFHELCCHFVQNG